jgi:hypothetical protein
VARGFNSITLVKKVADWVIERGKKSVFVYYLADRDFYGVKARMKLEQRLRLMLRNLDADLHFECVASKPEKMERLRAQGFTRDSKINAKWGRAKRAEILEKFPDSAELDAIPPVELRRMVTEAIERHLTMAEIVATRAEETAIRGIIEERLA